MLLLSGEYLDLEFGLVKGYLDHRLLDTLHRLILCKIIFLVNNLNGVIFEKNARAIKIDFF